MNEEEEERIIRESAYVSEIPEGGVLEIYHNGKVIVRKEGDREIEKIGK